MCLNWWSRQQSTNCMSKRMVRVLPIFEVGQPCKLATSQKPEPQHLREREHEEKEHRHLHTIWARRTQATFESTSWLIWGGSEYSGGGRASWCLKGVSAERKDRAAPSSAAHRFIF